MKFDEFNKQTAEEVRQAEILDGTYGCQTCDEHVEEAEWFITQKILRWKCSAGHMSFIEEFSL